MRFYSGLTLSSGPVPNLSVLKLGSQNSDQTCEFEASSGQLTVLNIRGWAWEAQEVREKSYYNIVSLFDVLPKKCLES